RPSPKPFVMASETRGRRTPGEARARQGEASTTENRFSPALWRAKDSGHSVRSTRSYLRTAFLKPLQRFWQGERIMPNGAGSRWRWFPGLLTLIRMLRKRSSPARFNHTAADGYPRKNAARCCPRSTSLKPPVAWLARVFKLSKSPGVWDFQWLQNLRPPVSCISPILVQYE